ncbi:MAG: glycosyltransferase family 2 protein [Methylovulum sp.]|nr:glycosyltransferase family 2 protein [Methylovulum sp.]
MKPTVSIIIKTLNEEKNIERCLDSLVNAPNVINTEVILADSLSADTTLEKARHYPIKIVQLENANDRSCGIGPQLGFQYAQGDYVYILDGDMEMEPDFLPAAIARLEANPQLAGVAGSVKEMCVENLVFKKRAQKAFKYGNVGHLAMGGLYKRKAVEEIGYFSNINLHSFEELELGLRLVSKGWALERIDVPAIKHHGHTDTSLCLILKRLKTKYVYGYGELIRSAIGKPYFLKTLWNAKILLAMLILWLVIAVFLSTGNITWPIAIVMAGVAFMSVKKHSIKEALFSVLTWHVELIGLILGLFRQPKKNDSMIAAKVIQG